MENQRAAVERPVTLRIFVTNVLADQVRIWSFPRLLLQGKHWRPTLLFSLLTCCCFAIDPFDPRYFRHTQRFRVFDLIVSGHNAMVAMWAVMLISLLAALLRADRYLGDTFLYAFEAVLASEILTQVLKGIDRRVRPQDFHAYGRFVDSWFRDPGSWYAGPGSFPSGHMIAAMSIATVFAVRYARRPWVPLTAYTLAGVIGFSRITLLSHFPSDVFVATVLGYVIARHVVLGQPDRAGGRQAPVPAGQEAAGVGAMRSVEPVASLPYREAEPTE